METMQLLPIKLEVGWLFGMWFFFNKHTFVCDRKIWPICMLCLLLIVEYDKKAYHSTPRTYVSLLHAGFVVNLILGCVSTIEKI